MVQWQCASLKGKSFPQALEIIRWSCCKVTLLSSGTGPFRSLTQPLLEKSVDSTCLFYSSSTPSSRGHREHSTKGLHQCHPSLNVMGPKGKAQLFPTKATGTQEVDLGLAFWTSLHLGLQSPQVGGSYPTCLAHRCAQLR